MGYARHIGRVGALAVTLGVGVAIATTPGISYADTPGSSTSTAGSSSSTGTSTTGTSTTGSNGASTDGTDGTDPSDPGDEPSPSDTTDKDTVADGDTAADEDTAAEGTDANEDAEEVDDADEQTTGEGDEGTPPAAGDENALTAETPQDGRRRSPRTRRAAIRPFKRSAVSQWACSPSPHQTSRTWSTRHTPRLKDGQPNPVGSTCRCCASPPRTASKPSRSRGPWPRRQPQLRSRQRPHRSRAQLWSVSSRTSSLRSCDR